jgi:hypothetical protein
MGHKEIINYVHKYVTYFLTHNRNLKAMSQGKGRVVPIIPLTEHHAMKAYWVSENIAPRILDLGTRWR